MEKIYLILIIVAVLFVTLAAILRRYRRCPSDKILVIYGKTGKNAGGSISSARCITETRAKRWKTRISRRLSVSRLSCSD